MYEMFFYSYPRKEVQKACECQCTNLDKHRKQLRKIIRESQDAYEVIARIFDEIMFKETTSFEQDVATFMKWLYQKPQQSKKIILTSGEKSFIDSMKDGYLARDKNGILYAYKQKPIKDLKNGKWTSDSFTVSVNKNIFDADFNFVEWNDNEPYAIQKLKRKEK